MSYLDDAEILPQEHAVISTAWGHVTRQSSHETDLPSLYASIGVAPRVQVAASLFHYASTYTDGTQVSGRGDAWLIGKVALVSPRAHPGGVALSPLIEILSDSSTTYRAVGSGRVAWGLPVNLQYTWTKVQVVGTAGYFSRGAVSANAGVQWWVAKHAIATVSLAHSHATRHTTLDAQYGLLQDRTDASLSADLFLTPAVTLFGAAGRTLGTLDSSGATSQVSVGVSVALAPRPKP